MSDQLLETAQLCRSQWSVFDTIETYSVARVQTTTNRELRNLYGNKRSLELDKLDVQLFDHRSTDINGQLSTGGNTRPLRIR